MLMRDDGFLPKARYTSTEFADLVFERLWSRVWQVACRVEQVARPGDYVVVVAGSPPNAPGSTNTLRVHQLGSLVDAETVANAR